MADATRPVLVIVDATNVMRSAAWQRELRARGLDPADLERASSTLVDAAASWAAGAGVVLELVFDGHGPVRSLGPAASIIRAGDADREVAARARAATDAGAELRVVTDDRALANATGLLPATSTSDFVGMVCAAIQSEPRTPVVESQPDAGSALMHRVDPDVLDGLERMRRGEP